MRFDRPEPSSVRADETGLSGHGQVARLRRGLRADVRGRGAQRRRVAGPAFCTTYANLPENFAPSAARYPTGTTASSIWINGYI